VRPCMRTTSFCPTSLARLGDDAATNGVGVGAGAGVGFGDWLGCAVGEDAGGDVGPADAIELGAGLAEVAAGSGVDVGSVPIDGETGAAGAAHPASSSAATSSVHVLTQERCRPRRVRVGGQENPTRAPPARGGRAQAS